MCVCVHVCEKEERAEGMMRKMFERSSEGSDFSSNCIAYLVVIAILPHSEMEFVFSVIFISSLLSFLNHKP